MRTRILLSSLLILVLVAVPSRAQTPPADAGRVTGVVRTADGAAVSGASVLLRNTVSGGVTATTTSNAAGEFVFAAPAGAYLVELVGRDGRAVTVSSPFVLEAGSTVATFVRVGNQLPVALTRAVWELTLGSHVVLQDDAWHGGGSVGAGYVLDRATFGVNAGWTRREGHNDWRAMAGPRFALTHGAQVSLFVHGQAGVVIRNARGRLAWAAGGGANVRGNGRLGLRLQVDALSDTGGRAGLAVVIR